MVCGKIFIISAPSGAGKTTLVNALVNEMGESHRLHRVVTYTTRQPRNSEVHGVDYHFVSQEEFQEMDACGKFLESNYYCGQYYGTPSYIIEEITKGASYILVIDRNGAARILQKISGAVAIWVYVADLGVLKQRLISRGTESLEVIERRLLRAKEEFEEEISLPLFHYMVKNDHFNETLITLQDIFLKELNLKSPAMKINHTSSHGRPEAAKEQK